jgi:hypothetical protein
MEVHGSSENLLPQPLDIAFTTAPLVVEPLPQSTPQLSPAMPELARSTVALNSGLLERDQLIRDLIRMNASINTPPEWRESVKLIVAAFLALGCWSLLGWLLFAQFQYSLAVSAKLEKPENKDRIVFIKDARDGVNQTSNSIYALLTPIAASITGYFFVSSGSGKVLDKQIIQDILPAREDKTSSDKPSP